MKIKTKVAFGVIFLFGMILMMGGTGLYYLNELSKDSRNILTDNYESLEYTKGILDAAETIETDSLVAINAIGKNLLAQEQNVTEAGESDLTGRLRSTFENLKRNIHDHNLQRTLRQQALAIQGMNMDVIMKKNEISQQTSSTASTYVIAIGTVIALVVFTFIVNFPGYIGNPIARLTASIKAIANKNYEERLHFDRNDEFGELSGAFNNMAERLDEYDHSNLARVLFAKKRLETIINRMTDPVIGLDENNIIVFANQEALSLLNLREEEVVNFYAPDVALYNDLLRKLIRTETNAKEKSGSLIKIVVGGKENYFSKENILIHHEGTKTKEVIPIGEIILMRNVTPFKELDLAKTNFIATISHELKTPIGSLQMGIKLLQDTRVGILNEEQTSILQTFSDETARLSKLINELLDLSQVESGSIRLDIKKTEANDIIDLALDTVKFQAERKHVVIEKEIAQTVPAVLADQDKTTWVLVNFLTNAIRYSKEHEKIMLRCFAREGIVSFSVEDVGPGIEKKNIDRLFEKFFQVPGSKPGTGLGLAISKEFIEAQGGTVSVRSEMGKGSTFTFSLNAATA